MLSKIPSIFTQNQAVNLLSRDPLTLMFTDKSGCDADENSIAYLRPETAQSIFVQFKNVLDTSRKKLAIRYRANWEGVPERDQPAQLHFSLARV